MGYPELEAFECEAIAVDATLSVAPTDAWGRPGLGEWTVVELVAHLVRAVTRVEAYLDGELVEAGPVVDRVGYWRFDLHAAAPAIASRARDEAGGVVPAELVRRFAQGWRACAARARALPKGHVLATPRGPMRLDEYLATRVVELVVHHVDLRTALDLPPSPTALAGSLTVSVLEGLLGSPRPRAMGRDRFIRAATGRLVVEDPRMPVLR